MSRIGIVAEAPRETRVAATPATVIKLIASAMRSSSRQAPVPGRRSRMPRTPRRAAPSSTGAEAWASDDRAEGRRADARRDRAGSPTARR